MAVFLALWFHYKTYDLITKTKSVSWDNKYLDSFSRLIKTLPEHIKCNPKVSSGPTDCHYRWKNICIS